MGTIKNDEIMGYVIGQHCVCRECTSDQEESEVNQGELITDGQEDVQVFCDRCQKRIL